HFRDYWVYIIKSKLVVFNEINIDGNLYVINSEIQCKGKITITTQLFITENTIIDQQLRQYILPILWNTKLHYDVPLQIQDIENKAEECLEKKEFDMAIFHLQKHLDFSIKTFGFYHHYVAIAYNMIGL
ncbi:hypothetical protein RFI_01092, partial [Reticulomyxa filosa]